MTTTNHARPRDTDERADAELAEMVAEDEDRVVLVDPANRVVGTAWRTQVHTQDTPLHRAFSVYLVNADDQVLITRRALTKSTWPGVWTNSCCGHPRPGESNEDAVRRRVTEELGCEIGPISVVLPDFGYRATDASGLVENEICPVYRAVLKTGPRPDPQEVMEYDYMGWSNLGAAVRVAPTVFSPWMVGQVSQLSGAADPGSMVVPGVRSAAADRVDGADGDVLAATLADVDEVLHRQLADLAATWRGLMGSDDEQLDTLIDLPGWLNRLVFSGGKRLRPAMCHWGFLAAGGVEAGSGRTDLVNVAAALELLHSFALVHDDVMDDSDLRRGRPSAQVQGSLRHQNADGAGDSALFGLGVAVLLGDLAHAVADQMVATLPAGMQREWYALNLELIAGQHNDLVESATRTTDLEIAQRVAQQKSGGYTVRRPVLLGAEAAQASPSSRRALSEYGHHAGRAFALRDDLLGVWGDPVETGKPVGDDLKRRKPTVLLALAERRLAGAAREALDRLGTPSVRDTDVGDVEEAMRMAGIDARVEYLIAEAVSSASAALIGSDLTEHGVQGLLRMADRVAWRSR